jgi:hypothetical protein
MPRSQQISTMTAADRAATHLGGDFLLGGQARETRVLTQNTRMFQVVAAVLAVIASEAKQSLSRYAPRWRLPRRFAPRNDRTTRTIADVSVGY